MKPSQIKAITEMRLNGQGASVIAAALRLSPNTIKSYIRRHPDGFWLLCGEDEAEGVAVGGTPMLLSQIIIAAGDGAKAALSAFDHLIRSSVPA